MMTRGASIPPGKFLLWTLLALPGAYLLYRYALEGLWPDDLVGPTGEWAARFLILALMLTPLSLLLPRQPVVQWLVRRRRAIGVASFLYALLHLAFYSIDMGALAAILDELPLAGIWTGWVALLLMLPPALTSSDAAMRALKRNWKRLQRLAYPAAVLTLAHWAIVHNGWAEAIAWFTPLAVLQFWRLVRLIPFPTTTNLEKTS